MAKRNSKRGSAPPCYNWWVTRWGLIGDRLGEVRNIGRCGGSERCRRQNRWRHGRSVKGVDLTLEHWRANGETWWWRNGGGRCWKGKGNFLNGLMQSVLNDFSQQIIKEVNSTVSQLESFSLVWDGCSVVTIGELLAEAERERRSGVVIVSGWLVVSNDSEEMTSVSLAVNGMSSDSCWAASPPWYSSERVWGP